MRRLWLAATLLASFVSVAQGQSGAQKVDSVCGKEHLKPGQYVPFISDSNGHSCGSGTFTGTVSGGTHDTIVSIAAGLRLDTIWHIRDTVAVKGNFVLTSLAYLDTITRMDTLWHIRDTVAVKGNFGGGRIGDTIVASLIHLPDSIMYPLLNGRVKGADSITYMLAGRMDSIRRIDTIHFVTRSVDSIIYCSGCGGNPSSGRLDSIRRIDTVHFVSRSVDSIIYVPLTTAGRLDSIRRIDTVHFVSKSVDSIIYCSGCGGNPTSGRLDSIRTLENILAGRLDSVRRVDTVHYVTLVGKSADSVWFMPTITLIKQLDSVNLIDSITTLHHLALVDTVTGVKMVRSDSIKYIPPGGYADSVNMLPHLRWVDSLKLVDSITTLHHLALIDSINAVRYIDTIRVEMGRTTDTTYCAAGAKSAADSVVLPSYGGSTKQYVTWLYIAETDTLGITGTGYDSLTTTNFPIPLLRFGNAAAVGGTNIWLSQSFSYPEVAVAAATATKFRLSAPGAGGYWDLCVGYYHQ